MMDALVRPAPRMDSLSNGSATLDEAALRRQLFSFRLPALPGSTNSSPATIGGRLLDVRAASWASRLSSPPDLGPSTPSTPSAARAWTPVRRVNGSRGASLGQPMNQSLQSNSSADADVRRVRRPSVAAEASADADVRRVRRPSVTAEARAPTTAARAGEDLNWSHVFSGTANPGSRQVAGHAGRALRRLAGSRKLRLHHRPTAACVVSHMQHSQDREGSPALPASEPESPCLAWSAIAKGQSESAAETRMLRRRPAQALQRKACVKEAPDSMSESEAESQATARDEEEACGSDGDLPTLLSGADIQVQAHRYPVSPISDSSTVPQRSCLRRRGSKSDLRCTVERPKVSWATPLACLIPIVSSFAFEAAKPQAPLTEVELLSNILQEASFEAEEPSTDASVESEEDREEICPGDEEADSYVEDTEDEEEDDHDGELFSGCREGEDFPESDQKSTSMSLNFGATLNVPLKLALCG